MFNGNGIKEMQSTLISTQNNKLDCSDQSLTEFPSENLTQNKSSGLGGEKILVVDDEPETTEEIAELLEVAGFTVSVASDPLAAIALVKSNEDISVVITDLSMPVMTGLELIETINAELPPDRDVSIIILTGQADTNRAVKALRLGASDFLSKPIDPDILIHATKRAVESVRLKYLERNFRIQLEHQILERTEEVQKLSSDLLAANDILTITNAKLESSNKVKSEFLTLISHELRTPLNAIIGFSSLMKTDGEKAANAKGIEYNKGILNAGNKLLSIIDTILELVDVGNGDLKLNKTSFNINDLINRVVEVSKPKADKTGVEILVQLENVPKLIYADSHRLTQVIGNILDNAIRFSAEFRTVVVAASGDDNDITFTIADQGLGMTDGQVQIAEEPFRQVDSSLSKTAYGMGLGLTMSRLFVELHGGELKIQSTYGEGTIVDIKIPVGNECNE
ncbi:MAG: signal transduction histidine kinase [Alphaproteobacteria bacterium]